MLISDPTPLPDDFAVYVPRALEIMSLFRYGEHATGRALVKEYSQHEAQMLLATMACIAAGLLEMAYTDTDVSEEDWMPHFSAGLTGWFT